LKDASRLEIPVGCNPRCNGCSHRELTRVASLEQKEGFLRRAMAGLELHPRVISPIRSVGEEGRLGYRNRTCLHARLSGSGTGPNLQFGLLRAQGVGAPSREPEFVPIPDCPVHSERVRGIFKRLTQVLPGNFSELPLVYGVVSGAFLTLVLKCAPRPVSQALVRVEWQDFERDFGIRGVFVNFHASSGKRIFSSSGWQRVWGKDREVDASGLVYGPQSFQQLIPSLDQEALELASHFMSAKSGDLVLDLYSGLGKSLRLWRDQGAQAMGVELGSEAVSCARQNAAGPGIEILLGRCSDRLPQLKAQTASVLAYATVLAYLNPPRTGLEPEVLDWLSQEARPERVAYLSCSPGTLARDLLGFKRAGYEIARLQAFDFFPQTHHVEALALLQKMPTPR